MDDKVLYTIAFKVKEGKEAEMNDLICDLMESTAKERGVLNYHWAKYGYVYDSIEYFESNQAAYDHLTNFGKNFAERYMSLGSVLCTTVYGSPNGAVKEILDGFGAIYMEKIADFHR